MKAKNSFLMLLGFILSFTSIAQTDSCQFTLTGKVIDEHDSSPLSFSYILHMESNQVVTADYEGNYQISKLCKGLNHFIISHIGCESDTVAVIIQIENQTTTFKLEHHAQELEAVWITEKRTKLHTVDGDQLDRSREGLIGEMMDKIPGVSSISTGSNFSVPVVHGMSGNRLSIINNDVPLQYQQWGSEHSPEIDPFSIASIELVSGTEALKYSTGNISGALVASQSDLPIDTGLAGKIQFLGGSNKKMGAVAAMLVGRSTKLSALSWRLHASGKKAGNTKAPGYYLANTAAEEYNYSANLNYDFSESTLQVGYSSFNSEIGIFPGSHIEDYEELTEVTEKQQPDKAYNTGFSYTISEPLQKVKHQTAYMKYSWDVDNRNKLNVNISRQDNKRAEFESYEGHDHVDDHEEEEDPSNFILTSYNGSLSWRTISSSNHLTEFGLQTSIAKNEVKGEEKFIPGYSSENFAFYGIRKWYFEQMTLDAGFRLNQQSLKIVADDRPIVSGGKKQFSSVSTSSGIEFHIGKQQLIKPNISYSQRSPKVNELYSAGVHHGTASFESGNSKLQNEKVYEASISYKLKMKRLWLDLYAYNKFIVDFIALSAEGIDSTSHGLLHSYSWAQTDANFMGIDLLVRYWILKPLQVNLEGSYLRARDLKSPAALTFIPANNAKATIQYSFKDSPKSDERFLNFSGKYVAKQNHYPINQPIGSPDGYFLLGASAGMSIDINSNKLNIDLSVQNILNTKYRDYMDRFRYFSDAMGRNVGLRINYSF